MLKYAWKNDLGQKVFDMKMSDQDELRFLKDVVQHQPNQEELVQL